MLHWQIMMRLKKNEIKVNNNESKMIKAKVAKNNKKQMKTSNKQKCIGKLSERLENDGVDYEE